MSPPKADELVESTPPLRGGRDDVLKCSSLQVMNDSTKTLDEETATIAITTMGIEGIMDAVPQFVDALEVIFERRSTFSVPRYWSTFIKGSFVNNCKNAIWLDAVFEEIVRRNFKTILFGDFLDALTETDDGMMMICDE